MTQRTATTMNWTDEQGKYRARVFLNKGLLVLLGGLLAFVFLFPFFWSIFTSLKGPTEIYLMPPVIFPKAPRWETYVKIWSMAPLAKFYINSLLITSLSTFGTVISCLLVAYGFARFQFKGKNFLFLLVIGTLILPAEVTLVPRFIIYTQIKWIDTYLPLIVPEYFAVNAFSIFLLRQFIMGIPKELDEAAEIDGASSWRILWTVILPLMRPALVTVAIFAFLASWNGFVEPLVFLRTMTLFPMSIGLRFFQLSADVASGEPREPFMAAASLMMSLPPILLFIFAQRYYIQGIVFSGLKR